MFKPISKLACVALALLAVAGVQRASAQGKVKLSKGVDKALIAAQKAQQAKNWGECVSQAHAAGAVATRTAEDNYYINEILGFCLVRENKLAEAFPALKFTVDSGRLSGDTLASRVRALAQISYQLKNYEEAIAFGNRAIALPGGADAELYTLVAQSMYLKGDNKGARDFLNKLVASQERNGQAPKEQTLQLILSTCIKMKENACITSSFEKLVSHYPKDEYWKNLVVTLLNAGGNDRTMMQIYRLAAEVNSMNGPNYMEMAQIALDQGLPGDAQSAIEKATKSNLITDAREVASSQRLLAAAKTASASDRATLAKQEADAAKKPTGEVDFKVGTAWMSYGQYPQAIAAMTRALAKGGVKNLAEAQLMLGIAYYKAGNAAEAAKAFKAVKGDATLERLGSLWALRAK